MNNKIIANPVYEKAVISTALLRKQSLIEISKLSANEFYFDKNRKYFKAIREVENDGIDVGLITVFDRLIKNNGRELADEFISEYASEPASVGIEQIVSQIKDLALRRKIKDICQNTALKVLDDSVSGDDLVFDLDKSIRTAGEETQRKAVKFGDNGYGWERFSKKFYQLKCLFLMRLSGDLNRLNWLFSGPEPEKVKQAWH
jgi:replicative DNA helicase